MLHNNYIFFCNTFFRNRALVGRKEEADIAVIDPEGHNLILGECKFWQEPVGMNILHAPEAKAESVNWKRGNRHVWYVLFGAAGFTEELRIHAAGRADSVLIDEQEPVS